MITTETNILPEIENLIKALQPNSITAERKVVLQPLVDFIQEKTTNDQEIRINFICTHNSRRSHLSQVWALHSKQKNMLNEVYKLQRNYFTYSHKLTSSNGI